MDLELQSHIHEHAQEIVGKHIMETFHEHLTEMIHSQHVYGSKVVTGDEEIVVDMSEPHWPTDSSHYKKLAQQRMAFRSQAQAPGDAEEAVKDKTWGTYTVPEISDDGAVGGPFGRWPGAMGTTPKSPYDSGYGSAGWTSTPIINSPKDVDIIEGTWKEDAEKVGEVEEKIPYKIRYKI